MSSASVCIRNPFSVNLASMDKLDVERALRAFNIIREQGVERDGQFHLGGLTASSDLDGYTVRITDSSVTLTIFFHNKFELDYGSSRQLDAFMERLENVARKKAPPRE